MLPRLQPTSMIAVISLFLLQGGIVPTLGFSPPSKSSPSSILSSAPLRSSASLGISMHTSNDNDKVEKKAETATRRSVIRSAAAALSLASMAQIPVNGAHAAPPIAIIAEELGYFPVTNRAGDTVYVPAKVRRKSSEQSILLAKHLKSIGAMMYGAYWCPHCSHQKELFGSEAWSLIPYVECSTKGFYYDANKLQSVSSKIDGFPTWFIPSGKNKNKKDWVSGEMPLERIALLSGYQGNFDVLLEGPDVPASGSCR